MLHGHNSFLTMKKIYPFFILAFLGLVLGNYFFAPKEVYFKHDCALQEKGHCRVENENYQLDFKISPLPINPLEPLHYELELRDKETGKNLAPKAINLRILGHDMLMQEELYFPLTKSTTGPVYEATRVFPTCTEEVMTWRLYLTLAMNNEETLKVAYDLSISKY